MIWRLNWMADVSSNGLSKSRGIMVNYRYDVENLQKNSDLYKQYHQIMAGDQIKQLLT